VLREFSLSAGPPSYLCPTCGYVFFSETVGGGRPPKFREEIRFYDVAATIFPGGLGLRVSRPRAQRRSDGNLKYTDQRRRVAATGSEGARQRQAARGGRVVSMGVSIPHFWAYEL
jgi:hypothetical protein